MRWTHVWFWRKWPTDEWGKPGVRKGQRCRVLAYGRMNAALIEFEDGVQVVTSRYAVRKATATPTDSQRGAA